MGLSVDGYACEHDNDARENSGRGLHGEFPPNDSCLDNSISLSSSGRPNERRTEPQTELTLGNLYSRRFLGLSQPRAHGGARQPARIPAKSNPWEDEAAPVPPAPGRACFRKAGRYRSPSPRYPPAGSCLAARTVTSVRTVRLAVLARTCQNGRSLPARLSHW